MPAVTVKLSCVLPPKPGLPMARIHSPTFTSSESPNAITGSGAPASILITATSVKGSAPTIRAVNCLRSAKYTVTSCAPATTWLLVRMKPSSDTMKPVPPATRGCVRASPGGAMSLGSNGRSGKKRRKASGSGCAPDWAWAARGRRVSMRTTAGVTASARLVNASLRSSAGCTASRDTCGAVVIEGIAWDTLVQPSPLATPIPTRNVTLA